MESSWRRKGFGLITALTAIFFFLCGCEQKMDKRKVISVACTYSPIDVGSRTMAESIDKFERLHPDIKVKRLWLPQDYETKLLTMLAGGIAPDIFRVNPDWIPEFVSRGVLLSLDEFMAESSLLKVDDFFPLVLSKYRFNKDKGEIGKGPIYGLGTDWSSDYNIFYNKDMFDKEGLPYPTESLDWDEFVDISRKLTKMDSEGRVKQFGCYGLVPILAIYQNGGRVFSEDGKRCLLDTPEAIGGIQFVVDLVQRYKVMPRRQDVATQTATQDVTSMFSLGKIGMVFGGRHYGAVLTPLIKNFKIGVAPTIHNKKRANIMLGPFGWVISSRTKYPEESWMLVEGLVGGDGAVELAKIGYNIPVLKSIAYSEAFLMNPTHPEGMNKGFLDEVEYTIHSEFSSYIPYRMAQQIFEDEIELALLGQQTAENAGRNAAEKINRIIKEKLTEK